MPGFPWMGRRVALTSQTGCLTCPALIPPRGPGLALSLVNEPLFTGGLADRLSHSSAGHVPVHFMVLCQNGTAPRSAQQVAGSLRPGTVSTLYSDTPQSPGQIQGMAHLCGVR